MEKARTINQHWHEFYKELFKFPLKHMSDNDLETDLNYVAREIVEEAEEIETIEEELDDQVECYNCLEDAGEQSWTTEVESSEIDEDSHEFYVHCAGCDREIEFGWSHPGRGGRIWPAECNDFNPWKSWPEPRY